MSYHSYLLKGSESVLIDPVPADKAADLLHGRSLDHLVITHWNDALRETLDAYRLRWPHLQIINCSELPAGISSFSCGSYDFTCCNTAAGGVLWLPEKSLLFSGRLFGCYGAMSGISYDSEVDLKTDWLPEARRYYADHLWQNASAVRDLLMQIRAWDPAVICPRHGVIWFDLIPFLLKYYDLWASSRPEMPDALILCDPDHGEAAEQLAVMLQDTLVRVKILDASAPQSYINAELLRCGAVVLAGAALPSEAIDGRFTVSLSADSDLTELRNRILTFLISLGC